MTYADAFNLRATNLNFNNVADAIDGVMSRRWGGTSAGTSTAYTASCAPAWTAYENGSLLAFTPHTTNTGAATINVNSLGVKTIRYKNQALVGGELVAGVEAVLAYDGTFFEILNHGGGWATWTPTGSGAFPTTLSVNLAQYQRHGGEVRFRYDLQATTTSANQVCGFTLPVTAATTSSGFQASFFAGSLGNGFGIYNSTTVAHVYKSDTSNFATGTVTVIRGFGFYSA